MLFVLVIIYYTDFHLLSTLFCKLILCKKWTLHKSGEPITKEKEFMRMKKVKSISIIIIPYY